MITNGANEKYEVSKLCYRGATPPPPPPPQREREKGGKEGRDERRLILMRRDQTKDTLASLCNGAAFKAENKEKTKAKAEQLKKRKLEKEEANRTTLEKADELAEGGEPFLPSSSIPNQATPVGPILQSPETLASPGLLLAPGVGNPGLSPSLYGGVASNAQFMLDSPVLLPGGSAGPSPGSLGDLPQA
jgi:hypothetical protein